MHRSPGRCRRPVDGRALEAALGAHRHSTFVMSTGVIGVQLPLEKLTGA
ncbi:MAG: hypothetical protein R2854_31005 [Caldilineaceae bacterium]